jgi:G3E family GTPase
MSDLERRLPVSVITGFLGSGKTTLINRLLRDPRMSDAAVVVNEFGEIGLDHHLVAASSENVVLLNSGCLCCTVRGDLVDTLRDLLARRQKGNVPPFGQVVIETTGLADPAPVIQTLMTLPVARRYRLANVVTTVDAFNAGDTLDRHSEAVKQAAIADRLLLTKLDVAPVGAGEVLRKRLARLNPAAPVIAAVNGAVDPALLFGEGGFDPQTKTLDVRSWLRVEAFTAENEQPRGQRGVAHDHAHDAGITSFCLLFNRPFEWHAIAGYLDFLVSRHGPDLLRVKGILSIAGHERPIVIHAVQHLFHPPIELMEWPDADRRSKIVMIVRGLRRGEIEAGFQALSSAGASAAAAAQ